MTHARDIGLLVLVAIGAMVVATFAAGSLVATPAAGAQSLQRVSDAQLAQRADAARRDAEQLGEQLIMLDSSRDALLREQDAARVELAAYAVDLYKHRSDDDTALALAMTSNGLRELSARADMAAIVSDYHARQLRVWNDAVTRLATTQLQRHAVVASLASTQERLMGLQREQARRAGVRARAHAAQQRDERRRAAAAREQSAAAGPRASSGRLIAAGGGASTPAGAGSVAVAVAGPGGAPTAQMLDAYLASKGSPMAGMGSALMASGQRWRVDPRLIVAIAGAESAFGRSTCGPFNAWGWSCPNDPAEFPDWAGGIDTVAHGLRQYYLDESRTSVALIQQKYCPVGAANDPTGLNSHWRDNVTRFLLEQGGSPDSVGPGPSGLSLLPDVEL